MFLTSIILTITIVLSCDQIKEKQNDNGENGLVDRPRTISLFSDDINELVRLLDFSEYRPDSVYFIDIYGDEKYCEDTELTISDCWVFEGILYFDSLTIRKIEEYDLAVASKELNAKPEDFNFNWLSSDIQKELAQSSLNQSVDPSFFFRTGSCAIAWRLKNAILIRLK